jgi:hypothetical protein
LLPLPFNSFSVAAVHRGGVQRVREGHDFQFFLSCCPEIKGEKATLYGYTVHVVLSILSQLLPRP